MAHKMHPNLPLYLRKGEFTGNSKWSFVRSAASNTIPEKNFAENAESSF
jgi:hypothetical protein